MRREVPISTALLVFAGAAALFPLPPALAQDERTDAKEEAPPTFSPEVEKQLEEFRAKLREPRLASWKKRMEKEVDDLRQTLELGDAETDGLRKIAATIPELCIEGWLDQMELWVRKAAKEQPQMLTTLALNAPAYASASFLKGYQAPTNHPEWLSGVEKVLSPAQKEQWQSIVAARAQEVEKHINRHLETRAAQTRENFRQTVTPRVAEIKSLLALSPERAKQLDAVVEQALGQSMEKWSAFTREQLTSMAAENREALIKQKSLHFGYSEESVPIKQPAWSEGLAAQLTPEEAKRLKDLGDERRARRRGDLAEVLLSELDEHVAFTTAQREALRAPVEALFENSPLLEAPENPERRRSIDDIALISVAINAKEDEIKSLLDEKQWIRWQGFCRDEVARRTARRRGNRATAVEGFPADQVGEPEDCEAAIADFLYKQSTEIRQQMIERMTLKVEDAARVASLSPEGRQRLETAARGSVELALPEANKSLEEMVREQTRNAVVENVHVRLAGIQEYQFRNIQKATPEKHDVWEKALTAELGEDQQAAWKKEVDARGLARARSIATLILTAIDNVASLTSEQAEKLRSKLVPVIQEHGEDIGSNFSGSYSAWYYQSYSMFTPVHGIPEEELKSILAREQWDALTGSDGFSNGGQSWQNIQRRNAQRKKRTVK